MTMPLAQERFRINWTDEKIETLKTMWEQGKTAAEISIAIGAGSRNAVIGKAHRLGLSKRANPVARKPRKRVDGKPFAPKQNTKPLPETNITSYGNRPYKLDELKPNQCRWPIGDPRDEVFHYCGAQRKGHRSYCPNHKAIAVSNRQAKRIMP